MNQKRRLTLFSSDPISYTYVIIFFDYNFCVIFSFLGNKCNNIFNAHALFVTFFLPRDCAGLFFAASCIAGKPVRKAGFA